MAEGHPYRPLTDAIRYLCNNRHRMDYPRYRRLGLPVTSAPMESLIKQMNQRVKGTEMFWEDPEGAEVILQIGRPPSARTTALTTTSPVALAGSSFDGIHPWPSLHKLNWPPGPRL